MPDQEQQLVEAGLTLTPQNIAKLRQILGRSTSAQMIRSGQLPSVEQAIIDMLGTKYPALGGLAKNTVVRAPSPAEKLHYRLTGEKINGQANVKHFANEGDNPDYSPRSIYLNVWDRMKSPKDMREFADTIAHEQTHLAQTRTLPRQQVFEGTYKSGNPKMVLDEESGKMVDVGSTMQDYMRQKWEKEAFKAGRTGTSALDRMKELLGGPLTEKIVNAREVPHWSLSPSERKPISQALKDVEVGSQGATARQARAARKELLLSNRRGAPVSQMEHLGTMDQVLSASQPELIKKLVQSRYPDASLYRRYENSLVQPLPNRDPLLMQKEKERLRSILGWAAEAPEE